jgi:signal transduction histidine kinase
LAGSNLVRRWRVSKEMPEARQSSKWVIVVTLAVVVAAFVGGSGYGEYRAGRTHALTAEIAANESPSIQHLASARAELRDLQRLLNTHVLLASTGRDAPSRPLTEVRERLRSDLEVYFSLPALPGERELWRRIEKELIDVDVLAGRILEETAARRFPAAQNLLITELPTAIDEEADAIIAAIQLNAERVRQVAEEIEGERKSRLLWIFGLDGVSVALAIALAVLALRTVTSKEEVMRRRSDELEGFAGRVAHDLLNPIAAVEMALVAAERSQGLRLESAFARSHRSLQRARRLIDDLLAFAQAGARPMPGAVALVAEVIDGVVEELRLPALERGITIFVDVPRRSLAVRCANGVLTSLLSNLVRNAVKHMGDRSRREVRLRVQVHGDRLRFEVGDTGPGLSPELMPRAFDPYVRGAGTAEPGLGLGLATVRRLVEGHDGRYGVRSELGAGALFWFELPVAPAPVEPANDVSPRTVVPAQSTPRNPPTSPSVH